MAPQSGALSKERIGQTLSNFWAQLSQPKPLSKTDPVELRFMAQQNPERFASQYVSELQPPQNLQASVGSMDMPKPSDAILDQIRNGGLPPAIERGTKLPPEYIKQQMALKSGDDLASFPSDASLPQKSVTKLQGQYDKTISDYMKQREKLIQNQQDRAKILRESESGMDLSPLIALVDSETGSNLSKGYRRPMSAGDRESLAGRLEQQASAGLGSQATLGNQMKYQEMMAQKWRNDTALKNKLLGVGGYSKKEQFKMGTDLHKSEDGKKVKALSNLRSLINQYRPMLKKHGTEFAGGTKSLMDNLRSQIYIQYKEAAKLGAITGPDMDIIESGFMPTTGFKGSMSNIAHMGGAQAAALNQLDQTMETMDTDYDKLKMNINATYPDAIKDVKGTLFKTYEDTQKEKKKTGLTEEQKAAREILRQRGKLDA